MVMNFSDKILITSGCSFSGGGNFNNYHMLKRELPSISEKFVNKIDGNGSINSDDIEFKNSIREYLWTYRLSKLAGFKKSINTSAPGKGPTTAISNIYNSIFQELNNGISLKDIVVILQLPNYVRDEIIFNNDEIQYVSIITEVSDTNPLKQNYLLNHYNEFFLYRKTINELYKLQKFCDLNDIPFYCWSYDYNSLHFDLFDSFNEESKNQLNTISDDSKFLSTLKSFDSAPFVDINTQISSINFINFDGEGMQNFGENNCKNFNFKLKYPVESDDSHPTTEGYDFISKILYEKIWKIEK